MHQIPVTLRSWNHLVSKNQAMTLSFSEPGNADAVPGLEGRAQVPDAPFSFRHFLQLSSISSYSMTAGMVPESA
jgi:hypothetical protein